MKQFWATETYKVLCGIAPSIWDHSTALPMCLVVVLCGIAPQYLGPLNRTADVSGRRSLPSSSTIRLVVPPFRLSTVGSWAFPVAAAKI